MRPKAGRVFKRPRSRYWIADWWDEFGRRHRRSTRAIDYGQAEAVLARLRRGTMAREVEAIRGLATPGAVRAYEAWLFGAMEEGCCPRARMFAALMRALRAREEAVSWGVMAVAAERLGSWRR